MATVSLLSAILTAEDFQSLNDTVRLKLEDVLKKHESDSSKLKIQYAKLQTQSEQQCFELDSQLQKLQEQGCRDESLFQDLTEGKARVEAELATSQEQLKLISSKLTLLEASLNDLKREKEVLLEDKENLNSLLLRRNDDLDRLTGEHKTLTDQLVHANKEKSEAIVKTEELHSKQLALEYKEKRLDQERELIVRQQRLLQDELDSRTKEVTNIRREKTSIVLELQADVSEKIEELRIAQKRITELTNTAELNEKHIKELNDRLKALGETEMKMTENNRNELRSQMRLCDLYKASSEDAHAKAEELTKATEELQRLLRDASARFGNLETESKAKIDHLNQLLQNAAETNGELKKELERANSLLDGNKSRLMTEDTIETMSPSAAAASRLLKSGMTLTQIYSQYVSVSEQLLMKEDENKKLNSYIDQILQEIEDRAPTIARQREDYEKSLEMVSNLTRQLDLAVDEAETEREKALEAVRLLRQSERNALRYEKQVADVGKQVCFLLREVEELRGNRMRDEPMGHDQVTSSEGSAAAIITSHLVTFRDVEELQQKNQQLLTTLREVTEKQDADEQGEIDKKTAQIKQALENALVEVEHLRDTRRRHEELMESVIQQRDMYRIMIQEAGLGDSQSPSKFRNLITSTPAPARKESVQSTAIESQLNESKARLEDQETKFKNLTQEKKEMEKELNNKIQSLQDQLTEMRSQNIRFSTQAQYSDEKEKLLQGNLDSCKRQLNALEEKNKMYACTVAKHEQSIAILRDEATSAQQQLARAEVAISFLKEEKQLLRDAEQRLLVERNALVSERHSQGLMHANLESIKLNLERGESESRMRLQNTVTSLEQQIELLRKKLDNEEQRFQSTVKTFEDKIQADGIILKAAEEKAAQLEVQLAATRERLVAAESRTSHTSPTRKGQLTRLLSTTPTTATASIDSDLVGDLRTQLAEARTETCKYQEQLDLVRQQTEQYRSIAESMEEELKKSNAASSSFKQETEQRLIKLNEERTELARNLQEAQDKLKSLEEGAAILGQETANQSEEVSNRVTRLEADLASMTEQFKLAEESEAKARQESLDQTKHAKEAQEKYERELMQHAADVEQLNSARQQLESSRSQLAALQQTFARMETELESGRSSWESQKKMLEKDVSEKSLRCSELSKQVDLMEQQIVSLSARMAAATRVQEIAFRTQSGDDSNASLNVSIGEEDTRSTDQLLELIRFLRREKEIAISRAEVQEMESHRLKTQLEQAERQSLEAQSALLNERERSATSALTSEKHREMLRRLETLNALTDSNRLLRDERVDLVSRVEELTAKITALETELEPLRSINETSTTKLEVLSTENQALKKQLAIWRTRTLALQEKAGRATADEVKKLQTDKEQIQKQLDQIKEAQTKTAAQLTETQRINTQLITAQQKLQEEARSAKEETQKIQTDMKRQRDEDTAKAGETANQLRRIARKYKTQFDDLKVQHDKMVEEKEKLASDLAASTSAASNSGAAASIKEETASAEATAAAARIQELEAQIAQTTTELDQLKQDYQTARASDEKTKAILKTLRAKFMPIQTLQKEKDTLAAQLEEARTKIQSLEQGSEELRSQLEARLSRLERENGELMQAKTTLELELETLNQRLPVLQRQAEAYQKQLALVQQQQQSQQTPQLSQVIKAPIADKTPSDNPPTANIKPMASGAAVTPQRPPVSSSPGQVISTPGQMHRTTPTASIRPMAMTSRTLAVQPTSVSVPPMAPPPLIAITAPTPVIQSTTFLREEEPVAGPSSAADPTPSTSAGGEDRSKKRTRSAEVEDSPTSDAASKRTRLTEQSEEDVEIVDVQENVEETAEEYAARTGETELVIEYEEHQQDDHEVEEEEVEEDLIENEEEEMVETAEAEEEDQEEEGDEIVVEIEEQREDVEEQSGQDSETALATNEEESGMVEVSAVVEEEVAVQQPPAEEMESEAFAPATSNEPGPSSAVAQPNIRPPPREDRLPSFGRNTLAFEDGGDDGIVPSTPVLLRPRTNDGFAEAVSSPQVNTRFVFGTVPELSLATGSSSHNAPSHLESQGMEDTRMDLSQLEENSGRSVPSTPLQVSPHDEMPTEEASVVPASGNVEESGDFEGGPDLEGDAAAEIDLLREDDQDTADNEQPTAQSEREATPTAATEDDPLPDAPLMSSAIEGTSQMTTAQQPVVASVPSSPTVRPQMSRRGSMAGFPRGRGVSSREDPRVASNPNRPVPITWSASPAQPVYRENPARVFRRAPAAVTSPVVATPLPDPVVTAAAAASPVPALMRGRGVARGRSRARAGRRM